MSKKVIIGLGLLIVLAFLIRVIGQWGNVFVNGDVIFKEVDPYWHMRLAEAMQYTFPSPMIHDMFTAYPNGYMAGYHPLLTWIVAIGGILTNHIKDFGVLVPPIFGAFSLIPMFLLGRQIGGNKVGFFSCLLFAVLPSEFFARSLLGFVDHHVLEVFFGLWVVYFIFMGLKTNKLKYILLSGLSLLFFDFSWQGCTFFLIILAGWALVQVFYNIIVNRPINGLSRLLFFTFLGGLIPVVYLQLIGYGITSAIGICSGMVFGSVVLVVLRRYIKNNLILIGSLIILIALGLVAIFQVYPWATAIAFFAGTGTDLIGELSLAGPNILFGEMGLTIVLFPIGIYFFIKERKSLLVTYFALVFLALNIYEIRWNYYFIAYDALIASYLIFKIADWKKFNPIVRPAIASVMCLFLIVPSISTTVNFASRPSFITPDWYKTCIWLRDNTPDPFSTPNAYYMRGLTEKASYGVLAWWDYGSFILEISHRVPLDTPQHLDFFHAKYFMAQNVQEAQAEIDEYARIENYPNINIKYIILDDLIFDKFWYDLVLMSGRDTSKMDSLLPNSLVWRLWNNNLPGYKLVHTQGNVRVFEKE